MTCGPLHRFDHLVVGVGELDAGIREFTRQSGIEPVFGGEHPHLGTHNALVALGEHAYLELVAPRPGADPSTSRFTRLAVGLERPTPILWAVATRDATATRARLARAGFLTTEPAAGSRRTPAGRVLEWRIFDLVEPPPDAPFFIEWAAGTPHPATTAPAGCALSRFEIVSDAGGDLGRLTAALEIEIEIDTAIEVDVAVTTGPRPGPRAELTCPAGPLTLEPR